MTGTFHHDSVPALLENHARFHIKDLDYPGLVPRKDHSVNGILVRDITKEQLERLDMFEGDEYTRVEVRVLAGEETIACQTYLFQDEEVLEESVWDFDTFVLRKSHKWITAENDHNVEYTMLDEPDGSQGRSAMIFNTAASSSSD